MLMWLQGSIQMGTHHIRHALFLAVINQALAGPEDFADVSAFTQSSFPALSWHRSTQPSPTNGQSMVRQLHELQHCPERQGESR